MKSVFKQTLTRYSSIGSRYTLYPTVKQFRCGFNQLHYKSIAKESNEELIPRPLSLYIHIPFYPRPQFYYSSITRNTSGNEKISIYLEYLKQEIAIQSSLFDIDRSVEQLHIGSGTPCCLSGEQLAALITYLSEHFNLVNNDEADFSIEIDPLQMRDHRIDGFRALGFNRLNIRIQGDYLTNQINSDSKSLIELTANIIKQAKEQGFRSINLDLICIPSEKTEKEFIKILNDVVTMQPDNISIYNYPSLPQIAKAQSQSEILSSAVTRLDIFNSVLNVLTVSGFEYTGLSDFAKLDDALTFSRSSVGQHRNFQGHHLHNEYDLLGLGVSAISQVGDSYSQNHSNLDDYYRLLDSEALPIKHGYKLDLDDALRRYIIMRLICDFYVDIDEIETNYHIDFYEYFYNELIELTEMEKEGLLEFVDKYLKIIGLGKLMISAICMVFDKYNQNRGHQISIS